MGDWATYLDVMVRTLFLSEMEISRGQRVPKDLLLQFKKNAEAMSVSLKEEIESRVEALVDSRMKELERDLDARIEAALGAMTEPALVG